MTRRLVRFVVLLLAVAPALGSAQQEAEANQEIEALELAGAVRTSPDVPPDHDLADVAALGAWLDGFMVSHLDELPTAGASVAIVKDGEVLIARGYGLSDVENDLAVGASTLFRIGSVSKLFTWTSVMQLVERGLIDLDADINEYMREVEVPATFDEPVTMTHLLTHTAGFEDHVIGLFGKDESTLRSFAEILNEEMPLRVRPPGQVASYSNHGTGMAAYIVEEVSGMSFTDYMQQNILDPLGMTETTIVQPIPDHLAESMSLGYSDGGQGEFDEESFEFVPLGPVGAVSSSANDMAKLMIAYMQNGRLGDARILSEETAIRMRQPLFRHSEAVNPALHGFMDMSQDGQTIIGHGGDTFWFHTLFAMMPEHDVGVFVSYNTDTGGAGRGRFIEAFLDRFFPHSDPEELEPAEGAAERLAKYAGSYRANRYTHSDFTKIGAAVGPMIVEVTDEGELTLNGGSTKFIETGDGTFRASDDARTLAFRENDDGEVEWLFVGTFQIMAFERLRGLSSPGLHMWMAGLAAAVMAFAALIWPVTAAVRWRYGVRPPPEKLLPRWGRMLGWGAAVAFLAFLAGLASVAGDANEIALGNLGTIRFVLGIGLAAAILGVATAGAAALFWVQGRGGTTTRVVYTTVAIAALVAVWQMNFWNLLGFKL